MTKLQAVRDFVSKVCGEPVTFSRIHFCNTNFAIFLDEKNPRMKLPTELDELEWTEADKITRNYLIAMSPVVRGFSHITLSLLHECGHWATRNVFDTKTYEKMEKKYITQTQYLTIPFEQVANAWVVCWLQNHDNRAMAKRFEREFFGY